MLPPFIRVVVQRLLLLLAAYFICRVFFLTWNHQMFASDSVGEIAGAFIRGVRFDIAAVLFMCAPMLLLWMLPSHWQTGPRFAVFDRILFGLIAFLSIGLNFIDVEFTRFIGKRFSYEYLLLHQDVEEQSTGIFLVYWKFFLGLFLL